VVFLAETLKKAEKFSDSIKAVQEYQNALSSLAVEVQLANLINFQKKSHVVKPGETVEVILAGFFGEKVADLKYPSRTPKTHHVLNRLVRENFHINRIFPGDVISLSSDGKLKIDLNRKKVATGAVAEVSLDLKSEKGGVVVKPEDLDSGGDLSANSPPQEPPPEEEPPPPPENSPESNLKSKITDEISKIKIILDRWGRDQNSKKAAEAMWQATDGFLKKDNEKWIPLEYSDENFEKISQFREKLEEMEREFGQDGEFEKTAVRIVRELPFLSTFTPIGVMAGLIDSALGIEKATSAEKATEGAKFVASIIPVVGNFVDIADGIHGLMTGRRMGTNLAMTTSETLFAIEMGIGGIAIDVFTEGTMGAPIKTAFKAGWKMGLKELPGLILKGAKDFVVDRGKEILKHPVDFLKDSAGWLGETFVVSPVKFVAKTSKVAFLDAPKKLWKNRDKIVSGVGTFLKSPRKTSKEGLKKIAGVSAFIWKKAKSWVKSEKSGEEKVAEMRVGEKQKLSDLEVDAAKLDEKIEKISDESNSRELARLKKKRRELDLEIENQKKSVREVERIEANLNSKNAKKVKKIEDRIDRRVKFVQEFNEKDLKLLKLSDLRNVRRQIDSEIKQIDSTLKNAGDLPVETAAALRRQREFFSRAVKQIDSEMDRRSEKFHPMHLAKKLPKNNKKFWKLIRRFRRKNQNLKK